MHRLDLFTLQDITGEEGDYEEDDQNEQRPRGEDLFLACVGVFGIVGVGGIATEQFESGALYSSESHAGRL